MPLLLTLTLFALLCLLFLVACALWGDRTERALDEHLNHPRDKRGEGFGR